MPRRNQPVTWILCDLGRTLIDFDHALIAQGLLDLLAKEPDRIEPGARMPTGAELFQFMFVPRPGKASRNISMDRGEMDLAELAKDVRATFRIHLTASELKPIWSEIFTRVHTDTLAAMHRARERGYRIALCSSTNAAHWDYICRKHPELTDLWDDLFLTFRMGLAKIDPGFFPAIAATTKVAPEEHLFLDDVQDNLDAARSAGMQTLHYDGAIPLHPAWSD